MVNKTLVTVSEKRVLRENVVNNAHSRIDLFSVPITALRTRTKEMLALLLDPIKYLPSEEGHQRDWRGLAEFMALQNQHITFLSTQRSSTLKLMDMLVKELDNILSLAELQRILGIIDRWDVIDDTNQLFLDDAELFLNSKEKSLILAEKENGNTTMDDDSNILTTDDVLGYPQKYDAFVLFADEDIEYATELIERLENSGFKLCEKSRDLMAGHLEHEAVCRLISERCSKLILIVTKAFLQSAANTFFVNVAQAFGIEKRRRMIIPCLYENCILPPNLSFYFVLNYQRSGKLYNFWDKLKQSIQNTPAENLAALPANPRITITEVDSPQSSKKSPKCELKSSDAPTTTHPIYNSTKPILVLKKSYSPEPPRKIMPPPQKMRTVSMWELSTENASEFDKNTNAPALLVNDNSTPSSGGTSKMAVIERLRNFMSRNKRSSESGSVGDDDAISTGSAASGGKEKSKKRGFFRKKKIAVAL
ncbi:uncharacterized protein DMENIID0001_065890 [Sergentomyia squamirostris]